MESKKTRIVAAVVDTAQLTLYKEDGTTIIITQGDPRLRRIIDEAAPLLIANGFADIIIDAAGDNSYAEFEKQQTSGIVKLFRIAKSKLAKLFVKDDPVEEMSIIPAELAGSTNVVEIMQTNEDMVNDVLGVPREVVGGPVPPLPANVDPITKTMSVIDEIMQHAVPVSSPEFHEHDVAKQANVVEKDGGTPNAHTDESSPDTIIAVVDGQIIPGMEKIKTQFTRAAKLGSTGGVEKFLQRIAKVINQRNHSIEDLLKFMERGDLPIADDGTILIYKVLNKNPNGKFRDCHTGKVEQWVGAHVCMDEKLVDPNRHNECSNGLHVARRGYVGNFGGSVCVLAKLAPEDVIAVPAYDANKMRVCGYHIIMELTGEQFTALKKNQPITSTEAGKKLLADAMSGNHVRRTHEVRITEHKGGGVRSKQLEKVVDVPPVVEDIPAAPVQPVAPVVLSGANDPTGVVRLSVDEEPEVVAVSVKAVGPRLEEALSNPDAEQMDQPIDPKAVAVQVEAVVGRKAQAKVLYDAWDNAPKSEIDAALTALLAFKKAAKVGWDRLGIPDPNDVTAGKAVPAKPVNKAHKAPTKKKAKHAAAKVPKLKLTPAAEPFTIDRGRVVKPVPVVLPEASEGSPRERIAKLLAIGLGTFGIGQSIIDIKKKSKKSWEVLGVPADIVAQLNTYQTKP